MVRIADDADGEGGEPGARVVVVRIVPDSASGREAPAAECGKDERDRNDGNDAGDESEATRGGETGMRRGAPGLVRFPAYERSIASS